MPVISKVHPQASPGAQAEVEAIQYAISLGQNHIDTAEIYANGGAEQIVGSATGLLKRDDLFIASKLWKSHMAKGLVRPAVEAMLKRLGTDYLDLLYIHAPWFDTPWQEAIPQISELIGEGMVRYFGVSNFNAVRLQEVLALASYPTAANQVHYSYMHQQGVTPELMQLCAVHDVGIIAYMPLEQCRTTRSVELADIAQQYNVTASQVALAWLVDQGVFPIPKALQRAHIEQNAAVLKLGPFFQRS